MRTGKITRMLMILALLTIMGVPTTALASFDGHDNDAMPFIAAQQEGNGETGNAQEDSSAGDAVGFVLGFLGGIIFLIIAVVAVVGAVGLGIIGIGYASVSSSEE